MSLTTNRRYVKVDCGEEITHIVERLTLLTKQRVYEDDLSEFILQRYFDCPSINCGLIITENLLNDDVFEIGCRSFETTPRFKSLFSEIKHRIETMLDKFDSANLSDKCYIGFDQQTLSLVFAQQQLAVNH